jgi:superfamily II DNA or RNA helicase
VIDPSKLGPLRKHQARALAVAREIVAGRRHQKVYVAGVTPGGGKTLMASLFSNELADHGVIEQVIVVVPNDPLRDQMRKSFHDPARGLDRYLRQQTHERVLPGLGKPFGVVATYQSLTSDISSKRYAALAAKRPTLLIFDECHHLCENKAWERGAKRLVDAAKILLAMSGTLWRWDEERIPFVNYDADNRAIVDIKYSRADALGEQAILPVEFRFFDGTAVYEHRSIPHDTALSLAPLKEQPRAVRTAIMSEEFVRKFLDAGMQEFERYRSQYYASQAIGVFHDKKSTRRACAWARHAHPKIAPVISLCGDGGSDQRIKSFRAGMHPVLFTVRKAYEGLDVPPATHLFYLGDSRSWPFLDQVIARVTRYNDKAPLSWDEQRGYVYVPDDKRIRDYVDNMMEEQEVYYRERERTANVTSLASRRGSFVPVSAEQTTRGFGIPGQVFTTEQNIGLLKLAELMPELRAPLTYRLTIADAMGLIPLAPGDASGAAE